MIFRAFLPWQSAPIDLGTDPSLREILTARHKTVRFELKLRPPGLSTEAQTGIHPIRFPRCRPAMIVACALSLPGFCGCALFGDATSLSSLAQDSAATAPDNKTDVPADSDLVTERLGSGGHSTARTDGHVIASPARTRMLSPEENNTEPADDGGVDPDVSNLAGDSTDSDKPLEENPFARVDDSVVGLADYSVVGMARDVPLPSDSSSAPDDLPAASDFSNTEPSRPLPAAPPVQPEPQRSVLDRIRRLSDPGLVRRQIERFPSPFRLFPGNDDDEKATPLIEPTNTAETNVAPGNTVDGSVDVLAMLISDLEQKLRTWPRDNDDSPLQPELYRRRQLDLRLAHLIADRPAAAAAAIESMPPEEQEFWQDLVLALSQFRTPDDSAPYDEQMAMTVGQLRSAVKQLQPVAKLALRRIELCDAIYSYGAIEPILSDSIAPGDPVLIYAELGNLYAELTDDGIYRTVFSGTLQLVSTDGTEIETWPLDAVEDLASSRREDYFLSYKLTLPAVLPQGDYEIRLTVRDDLSGRRARGSLAFSAR